MADNYIHINDIKLKGDDKFTNQFNKCSDYWQKAHDETLSEEERKKNLDLWYAERQALEMGYVINKFII